MRILLLAAAAAALAACATTEDVVPVNYAPPSAAAVAGAQSINVTVNATDARTTNRGRISTKINGYGMEMAAIRSQQEVAEIVEGALEAELRQRGYRLAAGGPVVNAAVETFFSKFNVGMLQGKAQGTVQMTVTVVDPAGREAYRRQVTGVGEKGIQMASGKNAAETLSQGLSTALAELFSDPAFLQALAGGA